MMGQHVRAEALFYYFGLEDQIPETHLLRLIEDWACSRNDEKSEAFSGWRTEPTTVPPAVFTALVVSCCSDLPKA